MNLNEHQGRPPSTGWLQTQELLAAPMVTERLPFTVRLVRSEADLYKAVQIRHSAYARHVPVFAESLRAPEASDSLDGAVVLLAESKLDGAALGTMRIQTNAYDALPLEKSYALPDRLRYGTLAEATRLGVVNRFEGRAVKTVMFKAFFQYCQQQGIDWMVIAARSPVDRIYERLMFEDVDPAGGYVPLVHAGNVPHRILCFEVNGAKERWAGQNHPMFDFVFGTDHVDIDLGEPPRPSGRRLGAHRLPHRYANL